MRRLSFLSFFLFASVLAISGTLARTDENAIDAVVSHAESMLEDGATVLVPDECCGTPFRFDSRILHLDADEFRRFGDRKFYLLLPKDVSPFDVRIRTFAVDRSVEFRDVQIRLDDDARSLWFTSVHTDAIQRDDYFLSLEVDGFTSQGQGTLSHSRIFEWEQNDEYRLVAFRAPLDPADPAFSLILQDQMLVTLTSGPNRAGGLIPSLRPTVSIRPANLGIAMTGGRRSRYRLSVGAGYGLSMLPPFGTPGTTPGGFIRLQIRFK